MTVEELRAEAKKLGYNIIPIKQYVKFLPCTCGCNRRSEFWRVGFSLEGKFGLRCQRCGRRVLGQNKEDAKRRWNEIIEEEIKNEGTTRS